MRKHLRIWSFGLSVITPLSFFVACGCQVEEQKTTPTQSDATKTPPKVATKKQSQKQDYAKAVRERKYYQYNNKAPISPYKYYFERTKSYGMKRLQYELALPPLRLVAYFAPEIKSSVKVVNGKPETVLEVIRPSVGAWKLEALSKIIVNVDGKEEVFDSDDFDVEAALAKKNQPVVQAYSNNPRSINSLHFWEQLRKARKFSFATKDAYWSDYYGNPTKYKLSPKDMLFSFLRTYFLTPDHRYKYGATKELDQKWYEKTKANEFAKGNWPNDYLAEMFGIDMDAFLRVDEDFDHKPLETLNVEGTPTPVFSIHLKKEVENHGTLADFMDRMIGTGSLLWLAPSEFLEEQHKSRSDPEEGSGLVHRVGFYWYGEDEKETLFASPYMPYEHSLEGGFETIKLRKNPNYWDKKWLKNPDNIREIIQYNQLQDTATFARSNYLNFAQGIITDLTFADLETQDVNRILEGSDSYIDKSMIVSSSKLNTGTIPVFYKFVTTPGKSVDEQGNVDTSRYQYNDIYAKFMYGGSLKDLAKGEVKTLLSFFGDDQIAFRSLLLAGVNWHKAILDYSGGDGVYSLTLAAKDGLLMGSDQNTSKYKTPTDAYSLHNSPFTLKDGKVSTYVPIEENVKAASLSSKSQSYAGGGPKIYAKLQKEMTALLDKVYAKNGWKDKQKMVFKLAFSTPESKDKWTQAWDAILETINKLDKKGRLKAQRVIYTSESELKQIEPQFGTRYSHKWGYDYTGNGTYVHGMLEIDYALYFTFLAKLLDRDENDPSNPFPMLTRLAKFLDKGIEEKSYHFKIPLREWLNAPNGASGEANEYFGDGIHNSTTEIARFLLETQDKFTNEEALKLNVEIAVLMGPKFNFEAYDLNPNRGTQRIVQRGFLIPEPLEHDYRLLDATYTPLEEDDKDKK